MLLRPRFRATAASAALVPLLLLSACGSDDPDTTADDTSSAEDTAPSEELTEEPSEEPETDTPAASGDKPEWARPFDTTGDVLATAEAGDVTVEIHQIGTAKAPKDGMFVDPENNEPILKEGDEIVFVNYVVTNNGDPIDLGSSLVDVTPRYADWKWMQGMDGATDSGLYEEMEVNQSGIAPGTLADPPIYTFGSGETFSWGDNFAYQKGGEITFTVRYTPVDENGDLVHDDRVEEDVTATIK